MISTITLLFYLLLSIVLVVLSTMFAKNVYDERGEAGFLYTFSGLAIMSILMTMVITIKLVGLFF